MKGEQLEFNKKQLLVSVTALLLFVDAEETA